MTDSNGHYVRAWVSRHDNGWEAWVCEDEHGDFHAWACESGAATVKSDAVEDTEIRAKMQHCSRSKEKRGIAAARIAAAGSKPRKVEE